MKKEYPESIEGLIDFLRDKSRERPGGHFWKVVHKGLLRQTLWGRSKKDILDFLRKQQIPFDSIVPCV